MKKILTLGIIFLSLLAITGTIFAAKPADNEAGAQKYNWHLSGDVMPVPPYGSADIIGSDTASKLIVNRPNGEVEAIVTGIMKGLNPNTTYTVYLSKPYTPYASANIIGTYRWLVLGNYSHDLVIDVQNSDGTFSGYGGYPAGSNPYTSPGQTPETITGTVTGNNITFTTTYAGPYNPGYTATVYGKINPDGSMSGTSPWEWHTTSGRATPVSGSTGWPGFLPGMEAFTFTTNEEGVATWHYNFREPVEVFSIWINGGGKTILISDNIN